MTHACRRCGSIVDGRHCRTCRREYARVMREQALPLNQLVVSDKTLRIIEAKTMIVASGCHLWTGATGRNGYGHIMVGGKTRLVHLVVLQAAGRYDPDPKLESHHECEVRNCINLDHLEMILGHDHTAMHNRKRASKKPD